MAAEAGHAGSRAYHDQAGNFHLNGANLPDSGEAALPQSMGITAIAGAANTSLVTFAVKDGAGKTIAAVFNFDLHLSDDAVAGAGLTATTASGAVGVGTPGTVLSTYSAKKAFYVQTDATGTFQLSILDTAKTLFVPCAACPGTGKIIVGAALVTASYG